MLKLIRAFLGFWILLFEKLFQPDPIFREPAEQEKLDSITKHYALYQFQACPFCLRVRRAIYRLNLKIELRNANKGTAYAKELIEQGGEFQTPCLRYTDANGSTKWLYESSDIVAYLEKLSATAAVTANRA